MSPSLKLTIKAGKCFPRVSGDEPVRAVTLAVYQLFSPRERG